MTILYPFRLDTTSPITNIHRKVGLRINADVVGFKIGDEPERLPGGLTLLPLGNRPQKKAFRYAKQQLRADQFDVVHTGPFTHNLLSGFSSIFSDTVHVHTVHNVEPFTGNSNLKTRTQQLALINLADEVTAVSSYVADHVEDTIRITDKLGKHSHRRRTPVVPNGVDTDLFHPERADTEADRFFYVGRLIGRKHFDLVLKLAEVLPEAEFRVRLSDIDETKRMSLNDNIKNLTVLPKLTMEEMATEYASATATLAPYEREGFGMAIIESLAAGTPVVGYNDGNISNLFAVTKAGILCETLSVNEWHSALESIELDVLSEDARNAVREYEWDRIAAKYNNIYNKLV